MALLYLLLLCASVLANKSGNTTAFNELGYYRKKDTAYILLAVMLIVFAGTRGGFNDTYSYIDAYSQLTPFSGIDWSIGSNPLFYVYKSIIKKFITRSPYGFLFITSAITVGVYLFFVKKHSVQFGYSVFLVIAIGVYGFTMAAVKQTLATAIALVATESYLKGKRYLPIFLLGCAVLIHPYVIVFSAVPFLQDGIWNKKSLLIILGTFLIGSSFASFMEHVLKATEAIGENYSISSFASGTGVSIIRVLVYCVVPALSFMYRKELRQSNDRFLYLAVNLSLLAFCFTAISTFGGAVAIARLTRYFDIFQCIVLPYIVYKCISDRDTKKYILYISIACYIIYYYFYYKNYIGYGWFADYFNHISIFSFIEGLFTW